MTPEAAVKKRVKKILLRAGAWQHWPVQTGYGAPTLDCHSVICGISLHIETKAPGKDLTKRQKKIAADIRKAGGIVLKVDGQDDYKQLQDTLNWIIAIARLLDLPQNLIPEWMKGEESPSPSTKKSSDTEAS